MINQFVILIYLISVLNNEFISLRFFQWRLRSDNLKRLKKEYFHYRNFQLFIENIQYYY